MPSVEPYEGVIYPLVAEKASPLLPAPMAIRAKKLIFNICAGLLGFLIFWGASALFGWRWLFWTGCGLGALVAIGGGYEGLKAMLAACPYCGKPVGTTGEIDLSPADENVKVSCDDCHQTLLSHQGQLRAFTVEDTKAGQTFDAPLFGGGIWPGECIVCGRPITRTEEARKTSVELTQLLVGRLSVERASVSQVPYCNDHHDAVSLTKKDDQLRLVFTDVAAHRRYLAVNAGKVAVK